MKRYTARTIVIFAVLIFSSVFSDIRSVDAVIDYGSPYSIDALGAGSGDILFNGGVYTKDVSYSESLIDSDAVYRSYIEFNNIEIPDGATITDVNLYVYKTYGSVALAFHAMANQPSVAADAVLYADCADGTTYVSGAATAANGYNLDLGASANTDLQALLASNWFAVGITTASTSQQRIANPRYGTPAYHPVLTITYTVSSGIYYTFNARYENGTATTISVTAASSDGSNTFNVTTGTLYGFTVRPTVFTWTPSAGLTRFIYPLSDSETINVTLPNSTPEVYSFTLRDYIGIVGDGDCYLESWRVVNGTDTLIERNLIWNSETSTPLVLENNKVYTIKVRRNTGALVKDFGYFIPVGDDPPTLSLTSFTFDQYYQPVTNWISVNATRYAPAFTTITVGYQDDLLMTALAVVTITNRTSGVVVYTANSTDDDHIFTWAGAGNTTTYVANLNMTHTYYGWVSKTWILDGEFTPGTVPNFSLGGLSNDLLSVFLVFGVFAGSATVANKTTALFAAASIAAMLKMIGMFSVGWEGIFLAGIFAVAIGLAGGAEK